MKNSNSGKYIFLLISTLLFFSCSSTVTYFPIVNDTISKSVNNKNELNILTYNVQTVFGKDTSKLDGLLKYINKEDYDFVVLQELFDEDSREYLTKNINQNKYSSIINRFDYNNFPSNLFQDSGIFFASQFPIVDLSNINFGKEIKHNAGAIYKMLHKDFTVTMDFFANKSIAASLYKINDSTNLLLFTTHIQAISTRHNRRRQLFQIKKFIKQSVYGILKNEIVKSPQNLIVLLTGDFNMDAYEDFDKYRIQKYLGSPRDLHKEFNKEEKEYSIFIKGPGLLKRFDYIFAYDSLGNIPFKKVGVNSINITDIQNKDSLSVSDHFAMKAQLRF